jgi:hypothetical protein
MLGKSVDRECYSLMMVNPQLLSYVREQHAAGLSQVEIIEQAQKAGWSDEDISAAIEASESNAPWAAGAFSAAQPTKGYNVPTYAGTQHKSAKGIIGLVMRLGAKNEQQANMILIVFIMVVSGTAAYLLWPKSTVAPVPPGSVLVPGPAQKMP